MPHYYYSAFELLCIELQHAVEDGEITWEHAYEKVVEVVIEMTKKEIIKWLD